MTFDGIGMTSTRTRDRLISRLREAGITNELVLQAMRDIPRHLFVDEALAHRAYEDTALPIGHGQTISQPYIVARMTELLLAGRDSGITGHGAGRNVFPGTASRFRVLEVGTGCGYQTAVLCAIADEIFSVERIEPLLLGARRNLQQLNYRNYRLKHADGQMGWPEYAPFDAILVTAAATELPDELLSQLQPGCRIIAPIGQTEQQLVVVQRGDDGEIRETIEPVHFVPLLAGTTPVTR